MLSFQKASDYQAFQNSLDLIISEPLADLNYRKDVLLPAIKEGNWAKLEDMVIYQDEKITIRFSEDKWAFKNSDIKAKSPANLIFFIDDELPDNVTHINSDKRKIINQIKCVALLRMYYSTLKITIESLSCAINRLRITAREVLKHNLSGFDEITEGVLCDLIQRGVDFTASKSLQGLNVLVDVSAFLPFDVDFKRLTHKGLRIKPKEGEQYPVIPPRIYFACLQQFSEAVNHAYKHRDEIEKAVEEMLVHQESLLNQRIIDLRCGKKQVYKQELKSQSIARFLDALQCEGCEFIDNENDERWMQLYEIHKPYFIIKDIKQKFIVAGKSYSNGEFRKYLVALNSMAGWLCLVLSGMRVDELFGIHPDFGAQEVEFSKEGHERALEKVYLLTTRQSKITMDSQKKDDVFVTTYTGFKAFFVLDTLHRPMRRRLTDSERDSMFTNMREKTTPKIIDKQALGKMLIMFFDSYKGIDFILTRQDVDYLSESEKSHSYKVGDTYKMTPHQARRSLAYYLIGYELCSFPALKQQLGHFSMAMTRWYARNASSYRKFWGEVVDERVRQQADIYVRIFNRMANGERVAGGKGKIHLKAIAKSGEGYFEDGVNQRLLTTQYWEEMLRTRKEHLHAIAPGMYCTNDSCSMRIAIDLTECVNCEFDYIENVVYAESSRVDGMRNLGMLIEMNDLNASSATRCYMQIKAAERIMTDLEYDYEPYEFSEEVKAMVIVVKEIA